VITSNVLLCSYKALTDGAKITYQVIDGYDWEDKESKTSKGYVFPATATLAEMRDTSIRSIERHIKELAEVKLLTRVRQRYQPSIFYIEDVSEAEIKNYLNKREQPKSKRPKQSSNQPGSGNPPQELSTTEDKETRDNSTKSRNDKYVGSRELPETTNMSFAYKKAYEGKENEINVNVDLVNGKSKRNGKLSSMADLLKTHGLPSPPKSTTPTKNLKRDVIAQELADTFNDQKSLGYYRVIANKIPQGVIYQTLGSVKEAAQLGKIRKSQAALFVTIVKSYSKQRGIELRSGEGKSRDP